MFHGHVEVILFLGDKILYVIEENSCNAILKIQQTAKKILI